MPKLEDSQVYLPDVWTTHAEFFPDKEAVICGDDRVTWRQFDRGMNRVANWLNEDGIGRGDKVAALMSNSIVTPETILEKPNRPCRHFQLRPLYHSNS